MTDPVDEWATASLGKFDGKSLVSAMRAELEMDDRGPEKTEKVAEVQAAGPLFERIRTVLGDRVAEVRASLRLTDSPCCLVVRSGTPHGYVERLLRESGSGVSAPSRILELNAGHAIVKSLTRRLAEGDARVDGWIRAPLRAGASRRWVLAGQPHGFCAARYRATRIGHGHGHRRSDGERADARSCAPRIDRTRPLGRHEPREFVRLASILECLECRSQDGGPRGETAGELSRVEAQYCADVVRRRRTIALIGQLHGTFDPASPIPSNEP